MPQVSVHLYATLRTHVGGAPSVNVDVEAGQTVEEVLERLGVPTSQTRMVFVDDRPGDLSHQLQGGERVGVFPAVGGG